MKPPRISDERLSGILFGTPAITPSEVGMLLAEVIHLRRAIREHRDQRGDDRCWLDDVMLYGELPEDSEKLTDQSLPPKEDFLKSCERYYQQRRCPLDVYPPGKMRIAELEAEVARLKEYEAMYKGLCK